MAGALDTNISIEEAADIDAAVTTDAHLTAVIVGDVPSTAHRFREVAQSIPTEASGRAQSWSSWNGGSSATGEVHPQDITTSAAAAAVAASGIVIGRYCPISTSTAITAVGPCGYTDYAYAEEK
jgi:hypothetical protein